MNIFEKADWFIKNFEDGSFNNLTNNNWEIIESEMKDLIAKTTQGSLIEKGLDKDIHYVIPYEVRIAMHKRLVELEPKNKSAIRKYAHYLYAFGDPPDEKEAIEMMRKIGEEWGK